MTAAAGAAPLGAPRSLRLRALLLNLLPALLPAVPFATIFAASNGYLGVGGIGIALYFVGWSAAISLVLLGVNLWLLWRRKQTFGLAYLGLITDGSRRRSVLLLLAEIIVPPLAPFVVLQMTGSKEAFWYLLLGTHVVNWLPWLGPSGRTLTDRLSGARLLAAPAHLQTRGWWRDALLIGPPLLLLPAHASQKGGALGGALAVLLALLPLCLSRGVRAAKSRGVVH